MALYLIVTHQIRGSTSGCAQTETKTYYSKNNQKWTSLYFVFAQGGRGPQGDPGERGDVGPPGPPGGGGAAPVTTDVSQCVFKQLL